MASVRSSVIKAAEKDVRVSWGFCSPRGPHTQLLSSSGRGSEELWFSLQRNMNLFTNNTAFVFKIVLTLGYLRIIQFWKVWRTAFRR